jgi:transmembrane sensor
MTDRTQPTRAQAEAADWFAQLGNRLVTNQALRDFKTWRDHPDNDAAYQEVEAFWETSRRQADDPAMHRMTEAALDRRHGLRLPGLARTPGFAWTVGLAGLVGAAVIAMVTVNAISPTYMTNGAEQRVVLLKDGSKVHLNVGSQVRVAFGPAERRLVLSRGEAFFEVAHDAQRPFIVEADGARVRAVGTKFDVRRDAGGVQVTLLEGVVRVKRNDTSDAWTLAPNQQLTLGENRTATRASTDATRTTSWTTGRLIFSQTPLATAVAEVNRYSDRKVELEGAELSGRLVNGVFNVGDTEDFVKGVSALFSLEATTEPDGAIHLRANPATPSA